MHSYSIQKKINTYTVDKAAIQNIENFLRQDVPKILNLPLSQEGQAASTFFKDNITFILYNSYSEEHFKTIADYKFPYFRNDISGLAIELKIEEDDEALNEFEITLSFSKDEEKCNLDIALTDENPMEKVMAIEGGLKSVMSYNKNTNWLLYPNGIAILTFVALFLGSTQLIAEPKRSNYFWIVGLFLVGVFMACRYFKGYCTFESKRQQQLDIWYRWFITGLAGFIVFATVLPTIRKSLLGF
jgi:hypothetical protein